MKHTDTSEKVFQNDIIAHLTSTGYTRRSSSDYNKSSCLDPELALRFVSETQPKEWAKFVRVYNEQAETKFLIRLVKEIERKGTIYVLRNGFKDAGCDFKMFYPKPNNKKNPELFEKFEKNIFSVIDELEYQQKENGNRLDLVIFINGIPILTIELKDSFSQGVEKAINQYKRDRDPREPLFNRCLVHFAVSDEKVYMTTRLEREKTKFLPFNKGLENPQPANENDYKTSYLYQEILQINQLSKLISNFIFMEKDKDGKAERPIFPRFHQLDCVNKLLKDCQPGKNFLIQHSAGSGKTKTIAWLSHGLINRFDSEDNRIYDMVIVISDRRVIDKQLQDQIKQIEKVRGIVEVIDKNSEQLFDALISGRNIVVTTLQKFPYVLDGIGNLPDRKYAVIIDEAHSSQSGVLSKKLKQVLATNSLEEAETLDSEGMDEVDEEILREIESSKKLPNVSFFAFTATPKNKTLEMFGVKDEHGKFHPYHMYTMKQAIEEGFILDVLKNYLSYETYFKLVKKIEDDPEYDEAKTKKLLRNFVEKHPVAISRKTEIMVDHFMSSTRHKIRGRAKAMVVTRSRLHAVLYKKAFDRYIRENGYGIKTLVAFTGTVIHDGQEYTEDKMNDLPQRKTIENAYAEDDYRILIVANKFQTGFDQPLLHTMYIDKRLNGIAAVQTLSRANRIYPNKNDTLILDFANSPEVIEKAFQPYYESTVLTEATDPHKLYELMDKLLDFQIYEEEDINNFVRNYRKNASQPKLHALLNPVVAEFKKKAKEEQIEFKKTLRRYQNIYSFLSQLIPFSDIRLEKMFIFNKFLMKKLPTINNPLPFNVLQDVDMDSYKIVKKGKKEITLNPDGELKPISDTASVYKPDTYEKLSKIVHDLNEAFGTEFTDDDKVFLGRIKDNLMNNPDLIDKIESNSRQNVLAIFDKYFEEEITKLLNGNMNFYRKLVDNDKLRVRVKNELFDLIYFEFKREKRSTPEEKDEEKNA